MPLAVDSLGECGFVAYPRRKARRKAHNAYSLVLLENVEESQWANLALKLGMGQHIRLDGVKVSVYDYTEEKLANLGLGIHLMCWACRSCGKFTPKMQMCSKCGCTKYCCAACQRSHWPAHKLVCKEIGDSYKKCKAELSRSKDIYFGIISSYTVAMIKHLETEHSEATGDDPLTDIPFTDMIKL